MIEGAVDKEVKLMGVGLEDAPVGVAFGVEEAGGAVDEECGVPLVLFAYNEAVVVLHGRFVECWVGYTGADAG